jgi:hypothetical protein
MQSTKSISIITFSAILSLSAISTHAYDNHAEKNKAEMVGKNNPSYKQNRKNNPSYKQNKSTLILCKNFPLCDVDSKTGSDEWPEVSVDIQK